MIQLGNETRNIRQKSLLHVLSQCTTTGENEYMPSVNKVLYLDRSLVYLDPQSYARTWQYGFVPPEVRWPALGGATFHSRKNGRCDNDSGQSCFRVVALGVDFSISFAFLYTVLPVLVFRFLSDLTPAAFIDLRCMFDI